MKSRINEDWAKSRMKKLCIDCQNRMIKKHTEEYERAIREGFQCGLAVAMKSQQLYRGYGKKRLQRLAGDVNFGKASLKKYKIKMWKMQISI